MSSENLFSRINQLITGIWDESGAPPAYRKAMQATLRLGSGLVDDTADPISHWSQLPGLCCQAAGGEREWADHLAAAWQLLYTAAHLMDSVEDQDEADPWWADLGPGAAINAASGLFFSASMLLQRLDTKSLHGTPIPEIVEEFYKGFLRICSGQHLDIANKDLSLPLYWEIAAGKSGAFFSLACLNGARLVTRDPNIVEALGNYGYHLGILVQILDDLESVLPGWQNRTARQWTDLKRSLPFVYAISIVPEEQKEQLKEYLDKAVDDPKSALAAFEYMESCGAPLYMRVELEKHSQLALGSINQVSLYPPAIEELSNLVHRLIRLPPEVSKID